MAVQSPAMKDPDGQLLVHVLHDVALLWTSWNVPALQPTQVGVAVAVQVPESTAPALQEVTQVLQAT